MNPDWISAEMQARIEILPIPLIKAAMADLNTCDIIKIKICRNLSAADSETYELKITTLYNGQPE